MFLFQFDNPMTYNALLILIGGAVAVVVAWVFYKSGLTERTATGFERLYKMEEAKAIKFEALYIEEKRAREEAEVAKNAIDNEFTGLSQLFSKKSVLLEQVTELVAEALRNMEQGIIPDHLEEILNDLVPRSISFLPLTSKSSAYFRRRADNPSPNNDKAP